tara:strand:- start:3748 stop:4062 length:315 start_codon:yes stop_codon:yes gene_type:complete
MTLTKLALIGSLAALTAGCATANQAAGSPGAGMPGAGGTCSAAGTDSFIGQRATTETGTAIRALTGAEIFQWVPEGSAVTMDYRESRVRVSYDRAMAITKIACG